ncbi:MAG: hypothetical protein IKR76_03150 [Ruminococcus sp.]|nr:hypothetical protein [Ruminococcus sp.]
MTELEIMQRAQMYIESLAKGSDPLTGQPVSDKDIINNARISRCLFYVSDVLKKVIDNGGVVSRTVVTSAGKVPFSLTGEQIDALMPTVARLSASKIVSYINSFIDTDNMQKLTATSLTAWLTEAGFLCEITGSSGKKRKVPTESGEQIGMEESVFNSDSGLIRYVTYDKNAQQFIFDNILSIADACKCEAEEKELIKALQKENKGKPWSADDDRRLAELYDSGSTLKSIAAELTRTRREVKERLAWLGKAEP